MKLFLKLFSFLTISTTQLLGATFSFFNLTNNEQKYLIEKSQDIFINYDESINEVIFDEALKRELRENGFKKM